MQAHYPFRHLLAHCETFWDISSDFEQFWTTLSSFEQFCAVLSNFFGPAWVTSSNFKHFCRASLGHIEQFWAIFGSTIWHCWPWTVFKMSQLRLLWDILLWLKKVADVNPTDLDPKTRSVICETWWDDFQIRDMLYHITFMAPFWEIVPDLFAHFKTCFGQSCSHFFRCLTQQFFHKKHVYIYIPKGSNVCKYYQHSAMSAIFAYIRIYRPM